VSAQRVVPVRVTEFSLTEEAFDPQLNPIRAKLSIGLRVLSVEDLPFSHKAARCSSATCSARSCWRARRHRRPGALGIGGIHERRAEDARRDPAKLGAGRSSNADSRYYGLPTTTLTLPDGT